MIPVEGGHNIKTLREIKRDVYGHSALAINKHSERWFEAEEGTRYVLSRTLDGVPPFFEAYGPFKPDRRGILPRLKVGGQDYWGNGWTWQRALRAFCRELGATITKTKNTRGKHNEKNQVGD